MSRFTASDHLLLVDTFLSSLGLSQLGAKNFAQAFFHRSALNECEFVQQSNERLEFLGDAILEVITTEYLYKQFPDKSEGDLTDLRSALVRGKNLAIVAAHLEMGTPIVLSVGEEKNKGRENPYILANIFEAFIASLYLVGGMERAAEFVHAHVISTLDEILAESLHVDPKSYLQEITQAQFSRLPEYILISATGPDHSHIYDMSVVLDGQEIGRGASSSKRKAHQEAAKNALARQSEWAKFFTSVV